MPYAFPLVLGFMSTAIEIILGHVSEMTCHFEVISRKKMIISDLNFFHKLKIIMSVCCNF